MSKSRYDIARLHKDCIAWCENPQLKPWMVEVGLKIERYALGRIEINNGIRYQVAISKPHDDLQILEFAHFIGLDVESYCLPQMTRDEAVRDYLDSIPEGGELVDGFTKAWNFGIVLARKGGLSLELIVENDVDPLAYTFLRLDTMDKYRDAV